MANYEILMIFDPSLGEQTIIEKIGIMKGWIEGLEGSIISSEDRGIERLSFEINKVRQGRFLLINFSMNPLKIDTLRKELRLDESVWRYMIKKMHAEKVAK